MVWGILLLRKANRHRRGIEAVSLDGRQTARDERPVSDCMQGFDAFGRDVVEVGHGAEEILAGADPVVDIFCQWMARLEDENRGECD